MNRPQMTYRALALIAVSSTCSYVTAVDVTPDFSVGGSAEVLADGGSHQPNSGLHTRDSSLGRTEYTADSTSNALLWADYKVEDFRLRTDVQFFSRSPYEHEVGGNPNVVERDAPVLLEQAFIEWRYDESLTLRAGRFRTTWFGWEGFHTADQWRVNHSAAWGWNVTDHDLKPINPFLTDGVAALWTIPDTDWHLEGYVANEVLGSAPDRLGFQKALGMSLWSKIPDYGRVELGAVFDPRSTSGPNGRGVNASGVDINTDITAFRDSGWFFAADLQVHYHPELTVGTTRFGDDLTAVVMANYAFKPSLSATLMLDYVERGFSKSKNEVFEVAVALLTRPNPQVRANIEVFDWQETADNANAWGVAAVVNIELP